MNHNLNIHSNLFIFALIGYVFGVALTWVMVQVMEKGQPALLWIFPSVLIPTTIIYQKNEYYIVSINEESFKNATIKSFSFENNSRVTTIQKDAFAYSTIESLNIPSSIINLQKGWCRSIVGLKRITIMPQNSKYIFLNNEIKNNELINNIDKKYFYNNQILTISKTKYYFNKNIAKQ